MTNVSGMRKKLLIAAVVSLVSLPVAAYAGGLAPGPHASFTVRGANIQDPLGHRFIVRGAVIAPGSLTSPAGHDRREGAGRRAARRAAARRDGRQHGPPRRLGRGQHGRAPGRHPQGGRRGACGTPRRHPLGPRRQRGAGADVRQLPRQEVPQGPHGLAAAGLRPLLRRRDGRPQPLHLVVGLARRAAVARARDPQRGHALADPALDAAPLGRPPPARALPPHRQGHRLRRALPRRAAHQAHGPQPEAPRQALRRAAHAQVRDHRRRPLPRRPERPRRPAGLDRRLHARSSPTGRSPAAATARSARPGRATAPTPCAHAVARTSRPSARPTPRASSR